MESLADLQEAQDVVVAQHAGEHVTLPASAFARSHSAGSGAASAAPTRRQSRRQRRSLERQRRREETPEERQIRRRARAERLWAQLQSLSKSMRRMEALQLPRSSDYGAPASSHLPPLTIFVWFQPATHTSLGCSGFRSLHVIN